VEDGETVAGCIRNGVRVWQIMEVVLFEMVGTTGSRVMNTELGFKVLNP
jgi:predicted DNA-binding protein with PD1-like motif